METISLKLEKEMLQSIDSSLKRHNFGTRTEFIRGAVREKLKDLGREELIKEFLKTAGKAKKHVSDKRLHEIREQVFEELGRERGWIK